MIICKAVTIVLLFLTTIYPTADASGMLVHMDITDRAMHSFSGTNIENYPFKEILIKYRSYQQAGSPFSDWGYLCKSRAGEETHWPPFIKAYVRYLEKTYKINTP